jgi:predicted nucleic acid-binding protein
VILYLESSAVLGWLLDEPSAPAVIASLQAAERLVASILTVLECDRALLRAATTGRIPEADVALRRGRLEMAARRWSIASVLPEHVERARRPFPHEPLRTLDALHLASALHFHRELAGVTVLALDARVRRNAEALGLALLPDLLGRA